MGGGGKRKARQEEVPAPPSHRLLTADELGLLKVTEVPADNKWEEAASKHRWGQPDKQHGVTRLQLHCPDWDPDRVLVAAARCGGRVTLHCPPMSAAGSSSDSASGACEVGSFRAAPPATTSGRSDTTANELRGLRFAATASGSRQQLRLVTATAGGHLAVHGWEPEEGSGGGRGGGKEDGGGDAGCRGGRSGSVVRTWEQQQAAASGRGQWREVLRMQTISDVQDMDVSSAGTHVALGGEGHQLRVWDLTATSTAAASIAAGGTGGASARPSPEPLFAGKAGKPSRSGLQDLAHVTAVSYVPGRDDQLVLVGTAKHKLWLYDMRAGRKPQSEVVWGEGRITALLPQSDGSRVWVGNGRGLVEALDLRQAPGKASMGHALKGSAGSIRSLSLHPSQPLIASVSLDRHLRVHSTTSRQLLARVYLKQALTGVAWLPSTPASADEDDGDAEEEDEENGAAYRSGGRRGVAGAGDDDDSPADAEEGDEPGSDLDVEEEMENDEEGGRHGAQGDRAGRRRGAPGSRPGRGGGGSGADKHNRRDKANAHAGKVGKVGAGGRDRTGAADHGKGKNADRAKDRGSNDPSSQKRRRRGSAGDA